MPAGGAWRAFLQARYAAALAVLCLGVILHALNSLITTTVLPSAVREIGGLALISWATTVYMVASIMTAVSGGLVENRVGGRRGLAGAAILFAIGTAVCAFAPSMPVLLCGRLLQGAGGGLISAVGHTMIPRLFPEPLWAKVFAAISAMWGVAALGGPLVGGLFAEFGTWRAAFAVMLPVAGIYVGLVMLVVPGRDRKQAPARSATYPIGRLVLVGGAVMMVAVAGNSRDLPIQIGLIAVATALSVLVLRLDRGSPAPLLPRGAFSPHTTAGAGLWVILTVSMATYSFTIYGPLLIQTLFGAGPLVAGYVVAWEALSWTLAAVVVASLKAPPDRWLIRIGPLTVAAGLTGVALVLPQGPAWALPITVFLAGGGIGMCWAFVNRRIIAAAADDADASVAAAAIPTTQLAGIAYGSALAGVIANAVGFHDGLTVETAQSVARWVHGAFVVVLLVGAAMAHRLVTLGDLTLPGIDTPPPERKKGLD